MPIRETSQKMNYFFLYSTCHRIKVYSESRLTTVVPHSKECQRINQFYTIGGFFCFFANLRKEMEKLSLYVKVRFLCLLLWGAIVLFSACSAAFAFAT